MFLFRATHGKVLAGSSSFASQTTTAAGRHIMSNPIRSSERYELTATSATSLNQAPTRAPGSSFHRPRRIRGSGAGRDTPDPSDLAPGGAAGLRRRHRTEAVVLCSAAADVDHGFFVPDSVGSMAGRDAIAC